MNTQQKYTEYWTKPPYLLANLTGTLNQKCVESAAYRNAPWNCIVGEAAAPFISELPVFAWQVILDSLNMAVESVVLRHQRHRCTASRLTRAAHHHLSLATIKTS